MSGGRSGIRGLSDPFLAARLYAVAGCLEDPTASDALSIDWGRRSPVRGQRRSLRLGSLRASERHITVHPVLDIPLVPRYVLDGVVYHELCHWVAPPLDARAARAQRTHRIHHRAFRALEARFPFAERVDTWIEENITWLIANAPYARPRSDKERGA